MHSQGQSFFTYPVTRKYPFRWFTWVVVIGGITCTILFSLINLATTGYNLQPIYTDDLNSTLHSEHWFQKAPFSWTNNIKASCQGSLLTTGASYFTTNLGLVYNLDKIWRTNDGSPITVLPAAAYRNAVLKDCDVAAITVNLARSDNTQKPRNYWSWGDTDALATATCTVYTEAGPLQANLTAHLPIIKSSFKLINGFLGLNASEHASLWFGAQTSTTYYAHLSSAMGYILPPSDNNSWESGTVSLSRSHNTTDFVSLHFFMVDASFETNNGGLSFTHDGTIQDWLDQSANLSLPNVACAIDAFGKSLYSTILTDLGSNLPGNALMTTEGVKYLQSRLLGNNATEGQRNESFPTANVFNNATENLDQAYELYTQNLGHAPDLSIRQDTTIFTQYYCSIPQRKDTGSLIVSILVADIVFLQVVWASLNCLAAWWLGLADPEMNHCEACLGLESDTEALVKGR